MAKFFDRVNHDVLMDRVARRVKDKCVLRLLTSEDYALEYAQSSAIVPAPAFSYLLEAEENGGK